MGKVESVASLRSRERSKMQEKKRKTESETKVDIYILKAQVHALLASAATYLSRLPPERISAHAMIPDESTSVVRECGPSPHCIAAVNKKMPQLL